MGFLVLIILTGVVIAIVASSSSGNKNYSGYHGSYVRDSGVNTTPKNERVKALSEACLDRSYYDEDDYEDYETSAARGERENFSDDLARDYNSYYAQVADAADMGDQDAIDEIYGEFGVGEW